MKNRPSFYGKCYYCICTACNGLSCPFKHHLYRCCYRCQERRQRSPRLDCDSFEHYIKTKRFRFKRSEPVKHSGTYIVNAHGLVFVGKYADLAPIAERLHAQLRKIDSFDFIAGDWK